MGTGEQNIAEAVRRLAEAEATGTPCPPVRELIGDTDVASAYAVQQRLTRRRLERGARLVGRKIGLTSKAVQTQLGVDQPDYGALFADMDVADGEEIAPGRVMQPKVEAEVAFVLGEDLDEEQLTMADVLRSVEFAIPAIEVVGSRIANWDIRIADTIADNASAGLFVLGQSPRLLGDFDLRLCGMKLERRGELVSNGAGLACMGSPLNATLWLARTMAAAGDPLKEGDVVLSGALGPMVPAAPGDVFEATIEGLGTVRAAFGA